MLVVLCGTNLVFFVLLLSGHGWFTDFGYFVGISETAGGGCFLVVARGNTSSIVESKEG